MRMYMSMYRYRYRHVVCIHVIDMCIYIYADIQWLFVLL